jgi:hypothetical protein
MGLLQYKERQDLLKLLGKIPNIEDAGVRRMLMAGFPPGLLQSIKSSDIVPVALGNSVDTACRTPPVTKGN